MTRVPPSTGRARKEGGFSQGKREGEGGGARWRTLFSPVVRAPALAVPSPLPLALLFLIGFRGTYAWHFALVLSSLAFNVASLGHTGRRERKGGREGGGGRAPWSKTHKRTPCSAEHTNTHRHETHSLTHPHTYLLHTYTGKQGPSPSVPMRRAMGCIAQGVGPCTCTRTCVCVCVRERRSVSAHGDASMWT